MKVCGRCNIEKSLENFVFRKDTERYESRCNVWAKDNLIKSNKLIKKEIEWVLVAMERLDLQM